MQDCPEEDRPKITSDQDDKLFIGGALVNPIKNFTLPGQDLISALFQETHKTTTSPASPSCREINLESKKNCGMKSTLYSQNTGCADLEYLRIGPVQA